MLRAADLRFAYAPGAPVLDGVSVEISQGTFTGILGPNGSGKTTLLRILAGTLTPAAGQVLLDGRPIASTGRREVARRMALVPQETQLAFDYSVLEVVLMGRYPHLGAFQVEGPADIEIAREALHATGTLAFEARPFATLSGGEKQRVIIAGALAQIRQRGDGGPQPMLLLDEPTTALDLGYLLDTAELLRELRRQSPLTVVMSTHDLNFAASLCDELVLLRGGRVLATGRTDAVLTPERVRALFDVEADVHRHEQAGHLVVVPLSRKGRR